ncbi:MAG: integrase core domain-containing protein, partial [Planctomycetota bacterium]
MSQMARNLTDPFSGFLKDKKYIIHDRDPLFTKVFRRTLKGSGVKPIRTLPMAPHLNCMIERFIRSIKSECLNRMLIFGERHLEYVVTEYMEHYNHE